MFGHVASFPVGDHALQIQSYSHHSENGAGGDHHTWLKQMDGYFAEISVTREQAWALVKGHPEAASKRHGDAIPLSK